MDFETLNFRDKTIIIFTLIISTIADSDTGRNVCHKPFCSDTPKICKAEPLTTFRCSRDVFNTPDDRGKVRSYHMKFNATSALMTCYNNYHRVRGDRVRHCMADGNWSGTSLYCEEDPLTNRYDRCVQVMLSIFIPFLTVCLCSLYQKAQQEDDVHDRRLEKSLILKQREILTGRSYSRVLPFVALQRSDLNAALAVRKTESFDYDIVERMARAYDSYTWTKDRAQEEELNSVLKRVAAKTWRLRDLTETTEISYTKSQATDLASDMTPPQHSR